MAVCDKWVALKIVEFLACVACLVAKRVSQDDEARLALLLQKLSREWSLLTSVTWDSVGGAFADAVYGGYVIITFGLILARVFQEVPKGRRILESFFLGFGMLFFLVLGGLELASLDSVPHNLVTNASVLGSLSLIVAALFLVDLMGPRTFYAAHHSQTDPTGIIASPKAEKKVSIATATTQNGNGHLPNETNITKTDETKAKAQPTRPKDLDLEKTHDISPKKEESSLFDSPRHGYIKFDDAFEPDLEKSKYGSLRADIEGGNYIRLSDPLSELHYEQELAKFNEEYYRKYLEQVEGKYNVKEKYLPELQTPVFAKVKTGRLKGLYDDLSPGYDRQKSPSRAKTIPSPTLQQLEDYLKGSRTRRSETPLFPMEPIVEKEGTDVDRASGTPTDPGYVQYAAGKWPDKKNLRTPRHSPT
ncbi:uncharacterized protein LOC126369243 [Pectinophora gossypiella]|nr:uncharacterized protein LOC126369243 [Pectinophora gossypiella]